MKRLRSLEGLAIVAAMAATMASCGGSTGYGSNAPPTAPGGGAAGGSTSNSISVADNVFDPKATTVRPGTTVTWTWSGNRDHNVIFDDGAVSATQTTGTFTRAFNTAGTYNYHCAIHGTAMSGSVTVQ